MLIDSFDDAVEGRDVVDQIHDVVEEVTGNRPTRKKQRLPTIGFIQ